LFFFFQAEDGIRDKLVTGVQTCALPICHPPVGVRQERPALLRLRILLEGPMVDRRADPERPIVRLDGAQLLDARQVDQMLGAHRSEERRVGKECGSGWTTSW